MLHAKRATVRLFVAAVWVACGFALAPAVNAGTNDNVSGWIWSGTVGWISLNCVNPVLPASPAGTCATVDYGVTLTDAGGAPAVAHMTGYAWSETVGWICFGTTCGSAPTVLTPEGVGPYAQYRELSGGRPNQLWGWAQVMTLGNDGWISLNCANPLPGQPGGTCATANYHVGVDPLTGDFNPTPVPDTTPIYDHFGWSGTDAGTGIGWIDFSIANTQWAQAELGIIRRPAGIVEPESLGGVCVTDANCTAPHLKCNTAISRCILPGTHLSTLEIVFAGFSGGKDAWLECEVLLPDTSRRVIGKILSSTVRNGIETLTYDLQPADATARNSLWYVTACRLAGLRKVTACANDVQCGANAICEESAGRCRDIIVASDRVRPVYAHPSLWTGLGAADDQYSAIKCNAGFPSNYFKNAAQCDFTADASFALSMRRGIPIEGDCDDNIDNDGNGQIDCADRYCKGISYLCSGATLPRTTCTWGQSGDNVDDCSALALGSGLCCSRQKVAPNAQLSQIVDGLECAPGDPKDGYYDCGCTDTAAFNASGTDDCFAPGYQTGDLCCDTAGDVVKL